MEILARLRVKPENPLPSGRGAFKTYELDSYQIGVFGPEKFHSDVNEEIFVVGIIFTLLLFFFAYKVTNKILNPIHILTDHLKRFGKGHLDLSIPLKGNDELSELSGAFNKMSTQVRSLMESKKQLLSDVSHELRSPLTRQKLAIEMLASNHYKESIREDNQEMEELIEVLLDSARLDAGGLYRRQHFNFCDLLQEIKGLLKGENILFTERAKPQVNGDFYWLKVAFLNIIRNALKYSQHSDKPVEISIDAATVQVKDYGIGIPAAEQEKIFDAFYRVDKSRQKKTGGLGLGLHIAHKVFQAHNWELALRSAPNEGTCITVQFSSLDQSENATNKTTGKSEAFS